MGLAEKRLAAEIEKEAESVKNWLKSAFTKDYELQTDIDSFGDFTNNPNLATGRKFSEFVHRQFVEVLVYKVGKDNLGKTAIKESIDKFIFKNADSSSISINNKVMEVAMPFNNSDFKFNADSTQKMIENCL